MVNNYPEYAAGVNYKKTDTNGNRHFYSAQVVADPANETVESKLIKDGVVIDEGGGGSSDFSTAEVTIVGGTNGIAISGGIEGTAEGYLFIKSTEYGDIGITAVGAPAGATITAKALLFKTLDPAVGHDFTASFGPVDGAIASVDGDCEILEETSVLIWGDCTITAS